MEKFLIVQKKKIHRMYCDGACRGNGSKNAKASVGVVVYDENDNIVFEISECIGVGVTNNQAEYMSVLMGMKKAYGEYGIEEMEVYVDSKLVCEQVMGRWRINNIILRGIRNSIVEFKSNYKYFHISHIPRSMNEYADELANRALDVK